MIIIITSSYDRNKYINSIHKGEKMRLVTNDIMDGNTLDQTEDTATGERLEE